MNGILTEPVKKVNEFCDAMTFKDASEKIERRETNFNCFAPLYFLNVVF